MSVTRRDFLKNGALALAGAGLAQATPSFLRPAFAAGPEGTDGEQRTLVCLFQRGGVDGLNMVIPHGDPDYYRARPDLAVARTGARGESLIDLDGFYGFHPAMAALKPLYDSGYLAAVHACGSPVAFHSHFDAQDFMETGAPGDRTVDTGWLARAVAAGPGGHAGDSGLRAVSATDSVCRCLHGEPGARAISPLGGPAGPPANGAVYPKGRLGDSLRRIAGLIKDDVGLEVAFAESGGWDTHAGQGAAGGPLADRLREFSEAIAAFHTDLGERMGRVVLLTMSEFGRTVRANDAMGTDHGHGTSFLALGGGVRGGQVYGEWPGLAPEDLSDGRGLAATTDYRDVFGEVAVRHLGARDLSRVFPRYAAGPEGFRGLIAA